MSTTFDNEVSVVIKNNRFRYWSSISIFLSIDSIPTVQLSGPFDPNDPKQREIFKPLTYPPIGVFINDEPLFSGVMSRILPSLTPEKTEFSAGAYSYPGELVELMVPGSNLPSQFRKQNLHEIAKTLCGYLDIAVDARVPPGPVFKKVKIEPEENILSFLVKLAKQRNQVISSSSVGNILFWEANPTTTPLAVLQQGESPLISVTPSINSEQYYSEITGIMPIRPRSKISTKFTVQNPLLPIVFRPYTFKVDDVESGGIESAVRAKLTRMYANAVGYTAEVATWRDAFGDVWAPNTTVSLFAPGAMIYKPFDFVVRSVTLNKNAESETASLDLMLPGSFTPENVGGLPWDE